MMMVLWILLAAVVVAMGYVRLAPSDTVRWHGPLEVSADRDLPTGVERVIAAGPETLARLDALIRATPRTQVLAGTVQDGLITYVTRSRVFGFPDYTTVQQVDDTIRILGRLRFGQSDLGVNKARVDGWIRALQ